MIKIFADGGTLQNIEEMNENKLVSGFTSNPTLMKKAGVKDYFGFMKDALKIVNGKPFSFEVLSDDMEEMKVQALKISSLGDNVYVKIPVMNSSGVVSYRIIKELSKQGVKINVTAITTFEQIEISSLSLEDNSDSIISVFAGRIADTGTNPINHINYAVNRTSKYDKQEVLWASTREVYNYIEAKNAKVHIITMQNDLIKKLSWIGRDLEEVSLDTVRMFSKDAKDSGFSL